MAIQLVSMPESLLSTATETVRSWLNQYTYLPAGLAAGALVGAVAMATHDIQKKQKLKKLPPGPPGHWLTGNFKEIDPRKPQMKLLEWTKQYGDIYTITIYSKPVVIINSEAGLREALVTKSNEFGGRPTSIRCEYIIKDIGAKDITFQDISPQWMALKKCFVNALRVAGENLELLEKLTQEHISKMCDTFLSYEGKPFSPKEHIHETISNIMFTILFGRNITKDSLDQLYNMQRDIFLLATPLGNGIEIEAWPWLRYMNNPWFTVMKRARATINDWVQREMGLWKDEYDPEHPKCVFDNMKRLEGNSEYLNDNHLKTLSLDTMIGGVGTTQGSVACLLAVLGSYPEVQKKLQKEVDEVLGSRLPSISDKEKLPYTQATVLELMRILRVSGIAHKAMCDTSVCGIEIPKGTECWMMYWNLHHNEEYFPNSWTFNPDRFIDAEGKFLSSEHPTRRRVFPFGAGRRMCAGEQIAKNRLFLIIAMLMQRLTITAPEGKTLPSDPREYSFALALIPPPHEIRVLPRK